MSEDTLHFDFETRSALDLTVCGLHNYATHKSTEVVLMAYAFGDRQVKVWSPKKDPKMPVEVYEGLRDPFITKAAWNASFERAILKYVLGIDVPVQEFRDPMVNARFLSMPGYLEDVGAILKLDNTQAKMANSGRFIKLFSAAAIQGGEEGLFGVTETAYYDWNTNPKEWAEFEEYVKLDVVAERAIDKKLHKLPLPDFEQAGWCLDQRINERGIPCNLDLCRGAKFIADKEAALLKAKLKDLTGLENPNSNEQMLAWAQSEGYPFSSLGKAFVNRAMDGEGNLTDTAREVLQIRRMTSKTSVNKFDAILAGVCGDGRLRHQFSFLGAQRTGRWSGKSSTGTGVQLQNLAKATKEIEKRMDLAIELVQKMDYDAIVREFGQPLEVASSVIRAAFQAEEGNKLLICDLAAIEARLAAWLSGCEKMLEVFRSGGDIYKAFATKLFNKAYEEITKFERNLAKPAVLGACYQLGAGEEIITEAGDKIKTGLLGYSAAMGIEMTVEQAQQAIQVYRKEYKEIVQLWYDLEAASAYAVRHPGQTIKVLPFFKSEKWNDEKLVEDFKALVSFRCTGKSMLQMILPSGRSLHYLQPELEEKEFTTGGKTYQKEVLSYMGVDQQTRQWVRQHTRGGHLMENLCQAVARDILLSGLTLAEENDMPVVAHVHDEIVAEVPENGQKTYKDLEECMRTVPSWAEGLPLDAAGFESKYYRKD